ncbi:hypothetical protein HELRODRAFT_171104 [Helobdella robusta]|uniref:Endonuclease/exonuclease/phosphatase domain-containing protein n=1 Tax=Helobdella robusta TaxID=6412 RepID=T1F3T3_HELRO|nr:hypothetical protein HELRODRAFT_171104 [Helobdella robusta]ESO05473.1 hypothetical protein HELRODRAFT_171104 [Helobdella robusta]
MAMPSCYDFIDFLRPHDPLHGRIIVYFRNNYNCKIIELPATSTFEALAVSELVDILEIITVMSGNVLVADDFNIHVENKNDPRTVSLLDVFDIFNLVNKVNEPTPKKAYWI